MAFLPQGGAFVNLLSRPSRSSGCERVRPGVVSGPRRAFDAESYKRGFESALEEKSENVVDIDGTVPDDLVGSYFRNGPGRQEAGGVADGDNKFAHPRDGDGMLAAFSFKDGQIWFQNRLIRTKGKAYEEIRERILYRGAFGTKKPGGWASNLLELFPKNASNDGVVYLPSERKLLSLWSMGLPHIVDPEGLVTDGTSRLRESLPENKATFSSRPKVMTELVTGFGKDPSDGQYFFLEFESEGFTLKRQLKRSGGPRGLVRDFGVTKSYFAMFDEPAKFDAAGYSLGSKSWSEAWTLDSARTTNLYFLSRDQKKPEWKSYPLSQPYQVLEVVDATEKDGAVYVDAVVVESPMTMFWGDTPNDTTFPSRKLVRFTLRNGSVEEKSLSDRCLDFVTAGDRFLYGSTPLNEGDAGPMQCIVQVEKKTLEERVWSGESHQFCGEPLAVAGQQREYVLSLVYDGLANKSFLLVLDGETLEEKCRIWTGVNIPHGRFGTWTPDTFSKENERKKSSYELFLEKGWNNMESSFPLL